MQCGSMISFSNEVENYWLNNCQVLSGPNILLVICIALIPHFHWDPQHFTFFGVNFLWKVNFFFERWSYRHLEYKGWPQIKRSSHWTMVFRALKIWTLDPQFGQDLYQEFSVTSNKLSELDTLQTRSNCYIDFPRSIWACSFHHNLIRLMF